MHFHEHRAGCSKGGRKLDTYRTMDHWIDNYGTFVLKNPKKRFKSLNGHHLEDSEPFFKCTRSYSVLEPSPEFVHLEWRLILYSLLVFVFCFARREKKGILDKFPKGYHPGVEVRKICLTCGQWQCMNWMGRAYCMRTLTWKQIAMHMIIPISVLNSFWSL